MRFAFLLTIQLLTMLGCAAEDSRVQTFHVTGTIKDASDTPLTDVTVKVVTHIGKSREEPSNFPTYQVGPSYSVTQKGIYTITLGFDKSGYEPQTVHISTKDDFMKGAPVDKHVSFHRDVIMVKSSDLPNLVTYGMSSLGIGDLAFHVVRIIDIAEGDGAIIKISTGTRELSFDPAVQLGLIEPVLTAELTTAPEVLGVWTSMGMPISPDGLAMSLCIRNGEPGDGLREVVPESWPNGGIGYFPEGMSLAPEDGYSPCVTIAPVNDPASTDPRRFAYYFRIRGLFGKLVAYRPSYDSSGFRIASVLIALQPDGSRNVATGTRKYR